MLLAGGLGFRFNETPSVPVGLWRISAVAILERGRVVSFCPPATDVFLDARRRGYLNRGSCPGALEPMLKVLAALPGDEVLQTADALFINGRPVPNSKALEADAEGRSLPSLANGRFVVGAGEGLFLGVHPRSFDSRYFGPLPLAAIEGEAHPILTAN
jgi:conjugative transfer signal peptidase TraF